jgi:hypothetical protein
MVTETVLGCAGASHLEEAFEPPHLEETLADEHHQLEDAPPLDARIGALSSIPVYSLAHDNVALLVLDLRDKFRHGAHCVRQYGSFLATQYAPSPSFSNGSWGASDSGT